MASPILLPVPWRSFGQAIRLVTCQFRLSSAWARAILACLKDGIRFLLIIFKVGTLYSPLKIFLPVATVFFGAGIMNYIYTYTSQGTFTNMSAVLLMTAIIVFLIGLVSEQVTALMYKDSDRD